ncbi:MAG: CoB--CoM heterodisulfide reductase iron-sulfur subunit A family protein [Bacteroidetes bacterium]|nr:CoB--CoM heterodisulfide reductase iron-sulfur subunit A family protein [Bacteroidota bacterium]MCL6103102.1 CoB--CoM heterodisulfide reductase iron-sulfur subunit A family protein [Bacteroidota bacterium]
MEEIRIGVYVCWCGTNISRMVDVEDVAREIETLPYVVVARDYKYMCSDPGQDLIINDIIKHKLNRIVVAACSPRIHELTFRKALENAGLNPYMFEMANIREHVSWVHTNREDATRKAKALVAGAVSRVRWHSSLDKRFVDINPATLIIGGGISGISAALEIADAGKQVYLIEKTGQLGGYAAKIDLSAPFMYSAPQMINPKIDKIFKHPQIKVFLNTQVEEMSGYFGNFTTKIKTEKDHEVELKFGNIILAIGLSTFDPSVIENYKYGKIPDVITSLEFEQCLKSGKILRKDGSVPKNVAIIHCVGSRNSNYHDYCSRLCCKNALKYSNLVRAAIPDANIFEMYSDMRAMGDGCEELYSVTSRKNVMFLMFDQKNGMPDIREALPNDNCKMVIEMDEKLSGERIEIPADLVILMVAIEAQKEAKKLAQAIGISMCGNQFFIERHPKLDPVATTTDGVFIVGSCQAPKGIPHSVAQARAATARILARINVGHVEVEAAIAKVNEDICCGCQTCISVCPYSAISLDEEKHVSVVNEVLCKGCGTCSSACPNGAIRAQHFTDTQILSQIDGLLEKSLQLQEGLL